MATTITLGRPGSGTIRRFVNNLRLHPRTLGDAWTDDAAAAAAAAPKDPAGDAAVGFLKAAAGWGILAFAAWSAGIQIKRTWDKS